MKPTESQIFFLILASILAKVRHIFNLATAAALLEAHTYLPKLSTHLPSRQQNLSEAAPPAIADL